MHRRVVNRGATADAGYRNVDVTHCQRWHRMVPSRDEEARRVRRMARPGDRRLFERSGAFVGAGARTWRRARSGARRPAAQGGAGVGGHAQRHRAARFGVARAGGDRAPRLRVWRLRHLHPHRLQHHLEAAADDRRQAGQRRPEPEQRRRDLLSRPSRRAARRAAEGRPAVVRAKTTARDSSRLTPRRPPSNRGRNSASCSARATTATRGTPRTARSSTRIRRFPPRSTFPRCSTSPTSSTRRRTTRATRSACCCGSTCRRCRRTPRSTARTATFRWPGRRRTGRVACSTRALGHASATWDNPDVYRMYFEALKWSLGLTDGDAAPRPFKPSE